MIQITRERACTCCLLADLLVRALTACVGGSPPPPSSIAHPPVPSSFLPTCSERALRWGTETGPMLENSDRRMPAGACVADGRLSELRWCRCKAQRERDAFANSFLYTEDGLPLVGARDTELGSRRERFLATPGESFFGPGRDADAFPGTAAVRLAQLVVSYTHGIRNFDCFFQHPMEGPPPRRVQAEH